MIGHGSALGAITIINATATGKGCAMAIDELTNARWEWRGEGLDWRGMTDDALAAAIHQQVNAHLGRNAGAIVDCASPFPPSRGLKTSSAAAVAMARAALAAAGVQLEEPALEALCIDAAMAAGVTITGAFDDQVAVGRGGCHITDNATRTILDTIEGPARHFAIWVPQQAIPKSAVKGIDATAIAADIEVALGLARRGDLEDALTKNGAAYHRLYQAAGLPVTDAPVKMALEHDALGAGLSGTGPAVSALFDKRIDIPAVPGGAWTWGITVGVKE